MTKGHQPAYPSDMEYSEGGKDFLDAPVIVYKKSFGMTKREAFAAMAMQGYLAASTDAIGHGVMDNKTIARESVDLADALIAELNKKNYQP